MTERIHKRLAVAAFGTAGFLIPVRETRKYLVSGTASRSLRVGRGNPPSRGDLDPVEAAGKLLGLAALQGTIIDRNWEDRDGYMYGNNVIQGGANYSNQRMRIWLRTKTM